MFSAQFTWNDTCPIQPNPYTAALIYFDSPGGTVTDGAVLDNHADVYSPYVDITMRGGGAFVETDDHVGLTLDATSYLEITLPYSTSPVDEITIELIASVPSVACYSVWRENSFGLAAFQHGYLSSMITVGNYSHYQELQSSLEDFEVSGNIHHYIVTFNGYNLTVYMDNHIIYEDYTSEPNMIEGTGNVYIGKPTGCGEDRMENVTVYYLRIDRRAKQIEEIDRPDQLCKY